MSFITKKCDYTIWHRLKTTSDLTILCCGLTKINLHTRKQLMFSESCSRKSSRSKPLKKFWVPLIKSLMLFVPQFSHGVYIIAQYDLGNWFFFIWKLKRPFRRDNPGQKDRQMSKCSNVENVCLFIFAFPHWSVSFDSQWVFQWFVFFSSPTF